MTGSASRSAFTVSAGMLVGAVLVIVIIAIVVVVAPAQIEIVQDNADQIGADIPSICPGPLRQLSRRLTTLDHQNDALDQRVEAFEPGGPDGCAPVLLAGQVAHQA